MASEVEVLSRCVRPTVLIGAYGGSGRAPSLDERS